MKNIKHQPYWLIEQVKSVQNKRDWSKLPNSFEFDQVKRLRNNSIEHLRVLDPAGTIKMRIALGKATTFADLIEILETNVPEEFKTPREEMP